MPRSAALSWTSVDSPVPRNAGPRSAGLSATLGLSNHRPGSALAGTGRRTRRVDSFGGTLARARPVLISRAADSVPPQRRPIPARLRVTVGATDAADLAGLMAVDDLGATLEPLPQHENLPGFFANVRNHRLADSGDRRCLALASMR